jgi:DNA-directed RNA polymerase specialized sigma subunit
MSPEEIAKKLNIDIEKIKEILGKTPIYAPVYAPRMRYSGWVNGR